MVQCSVTKDYLNKLGPLIKQYFHWTTGTKDGQTKLVKVGNIVEAYSWSGADSKWNKIGDVVGTEGDDTQPSSSKVMYEGKVGQRKGQSLFESLTCSFL